jgi:hypothetical protein
MLLGGSSLNQSSFRTTWRIVTWKLSTIVRKRRPCEKVRGNGEGEREMAEKIKAMEQAMMNVATSSSVLKYRGDFAWCG